MLRGVRVVPVSIGKDCGGTAVCAGGQLEVIWRVGLASVPLSVSDFLPSE